MLRDPVQTFASWNYMEPGIEPQFLAFWQSHTIDMLTKHSTDGTKIVPFTYELLEGQERQTLTTLLGKVGLQSKDFALDFNSLAIEAKVVQGQAANQAYRQKLLQPILDRATFAHHRNSYPLDDATIREVIRLCQDDYEAFHELAQREMNNR